jgi:hypothetical protein
VTVQPLAGQDTLQLPPPQSTSQASPSSHETLHIPAASHATSQVGVPVHLTSHCAAPSHCAVQLPESRQSTVQFSSGMQIAAQAALPSHETLQVPTSVHTAVQSWPVGQSQILRPLQISSGGKPGSGRPPHPRNNQKPSKIPCRVLMSPMNAGAQKPPRMSSLFVGVLRQKRQRQPGPAAGHRDFRN